MRQIGSQVGLDEAQTAAALSALVPALSAGVRQNAQTPDGLSGLIGALSAGTISGMSIIPRFGNTLTNQ